MSFEGFYQALCQNGHKCGGDVYCWEPNNSRCDECNALIVWQNLVDVTNGSFDKNDNRIDGYIELEIDKPGEVCTCSSCGNPHQLNSDTYKIPST